MEFLVDRSDDGSDGSFNGLNSGPQRTGILLGIFVERREAYHDVHRRHLHEIQIFQLLLLIFQNLQLPNHRSINTFLQIELNR